MTTTPATWTAPFHGVQHLKNTGKASRVSVADYSSFALLKCWFPGCGFNPIETKHNDAAAARQAGEQWIAGQP